MAGTLSTQELAQLRADAEDYLPDTCTLQTVTRTKDAQGYWAEAWADTYTNVPCRLAPQRMARAEGIEGDKLAAVTGWVLTLHHDQAVDETMRVVHDGETYEISQLEDTHSNRTAKRVQMRRVD